MQCLSDCSIPIFLILCFVGLSISSRDRHRKTNKEKKQERIEVHSPGEIHSTSIWCNASIMGKCTCIAPKKRIKNQP